MELLAARQFRVIQAISINHRWHTAESWYTRYWHLEPVASNSFHIPVASQVPAKVSMNRPGENAGVHACGTIDTSRFRVSQCENTKGGGYIKKSDRYNSTRALAPGPISWLCNIVEDFCCSCHVVDRVAAWEGKTIPALRMASLSPSGSSLWAKGQGIVWTSWCPHHAHLGS